MSVPEEKLLSESYLYRKNFYRKVTFINIDSRHEHNFLREKESVLVKHINTLYMYIDTLNFRKVALILFC